MTAPYSNTIKFQHRRSGQEYLYPKLDISDLTAAFFDRSRHKLNVAVLKALINQFTNACGDASYMESQGLLASTLIELIVAKYAYEKRESDFISEKDFHSQTMPLLELAIQNTALSREIQDHVLNHLKGAFRRSFRWKIKLLRDELSLPLNSNKIGRLVGTRNSLVHEGTYNSNFEDGGWDYDYHLIIWANLIALCRLSGYEGELPELKERPSIEV